MVAKRIAIIGAGVNGTSIATACARNGHDVTLFDSGLAFAQTSSKSSRMLHGGIRYLEQGHFGLVREALFEREEWQRIAPHATRVERFFFPIYDDSPRGRAVLYTGALLYQWLAGRFSVGKSRLHSRKDTLSLFPSLKPVGLRGAVSYCDVVMNDTLLSEHLLQEAISQGVSVITHTAVSCLSTQGTLDVNGEQRHFDRVINAAGPWAGQLLETAAIKSKFSVKHVRGSHLLLNASLPHALVFQMASDKRIIFAIPQSQQEVLLGTTEHGHDLNDAIVCTEMEVDYLLGAFNSHTTANVDRSHITATLSGVRPIASRSPGSLSNMSSASRDSEIEMTENLINVFGGKWTSARHLGRKVAKLL